MCYSIWDLRGGTDEVLVGLVEENGVVGLWGLVYIYTSIERLRAKRSKVRRRTGILTVWIPRTGAS
jgi:hypothetical protein